MWLSGSVVQLRWRRISVIERTVDSIRTIPRNHAIFQFRPIAQTSSQLYPMENPAMVDPNFVLFAAAHTPLNSSGQLNLSAVEKQFEHFVANQIGGVFIGGSTGEYSSLTVAQRNDLASQWSAVAGDSNLRLIVHVGHNCQADSIAMAKHAQSLNVEGISALAPSYFKPPTIDNLIEFLQPIAGATTKPFYYYDIPGLTGVHLPASELLHQQHRMPTLAGIKFTSPDMCEFQKCVQFESGRYEILFGTDEWLMAGLCFGAGGAIGSTYNFAAPLYHKLIDAVKNNQWDTARELQLESIRLIEILVKYKFTGGAKAVMKMIGIDCGNTLPPNHLLTAGEYDALKKELEEFGYFEKWAKLS